MTAAALRAAVGAPDAAASMPAGVVFAVALLAVALASGWRPGRPRIGAAALGAAGGGALVATPSQPSGVAEGTQLDEPIVAHLANLQTGEIHLYFGTRKVTHHDRRLAAQLYRATK